MEDLKRERTQYRRIFTKACNEFEKIEKNLELDEKVVKLQVIEEKAKLMMACEESVKKHVFEETDETRLEKELDEMEAYLDRARVIKKKLEKLSLEQASKSNQVLEDASTVSGHSQNALRYPTIKLPTFDGDVRNYLNFWGQFEKVDKDPNLDLHDKFAYLSQTMKEGSPADELLKSFPPGGQSYEKALNQLKARFGREELLIQVYVRDLLSLVLQRQNSAKFSLRKLYDSLVSKLRSLELLGVTSEKYAAMLFPLVESSLPEGILIAWERYRAVNRRVLEDSVPSQGEKSELECILDFLQSEVEAEERIELASCSLTQHKSRDPGRGYPKAAYNQEKDRGKLPFDRAREIPSATDLFTTAQVPKKCIFCSFSHPSADCVKARKMKLKEREELVQQSRCCFLCLKPGHPVYKCFVKTSCLCCGRKHNILLCRSMQWKSESAEKGSAPETKPVEGSARKDQVLTSFCSKPSVALQTLKVVIRGNGEKRTARAIIDSASQRSYLLRDTAEEMAYQPEGFEFLQHSLFGGKSTDVCKHDVFTLYLSSVDDTYDCNFKVLSQPIICESIPPLVDKAILQEFSQCGVVPVNDCQGPIEVLIGADVAGKLLTGCHQLLPCGLAAVQTRLGWTVMGRMPQFSSDESASLVVTSMLSRVVSVADLWSLDILGISDPSAKKNQIQLQEAAKEHFLSTVKVQEHRFVVHLPWLEDHAVLPDNYEVALKRLETTVRRLKTDSLYEDYEAVLRGWCSDGIIEEVKGYELVPAHYLPHRAVVKENSTTRIRPVFDASAKIKGFPSLNDCLEKGPNMIELIPNILLRFREKEIGVISDISKAFLQISVAPSDRDFLRFLWRDTGGELKTYRHCRVVFGVSCSPFLLASTIQYNLHGVLAKIASGESHYPREVIEKLLLSFYVDNCVTSVADRDELNLFIRVSTEVMANRKFLLRGWEHTDSKTECPVDSNVLGITWDRKSDTLRVNTTGLKELCFDKVTKRTILSAAHRVFDPIGITCPVTLIPKLLLQKLWKMNLNWDDEVDLETKKDFLKWVADSVFLNSIIIPRYFGGRNIENCTIHFFCDASKLAYAVVAFVRIETPEAVRVHLLQARSRVAPTGKEETTITRLELLAATITSRLSSNVLPEMSCDASYFWTDSTTVLAWITRNEQWSVFVQNRVKEIRELTDAKSWRHVPGSMNPADLPSRGCSAQHLFRLRWYEGPSWLYLPKEEWPESRVVSDESEVSKEKKKGVTSSSCLVASTTSRDWYYNYFSRYSQIVNLVAWILRFVHNCRTEISERYKGCLKLEEVCEAERKIVQMIQEDVFVLGEERLKTLKTFKDENHIIRLKTKLIFREDTEEFRSPAVLPSEHEVVKRLILHYHVKMQHAGTQILLNLLREKYWIINGRRAIRSVVHKCIKCKRFSAKNLDTHSAPLPENRVRDAAVFEVCGIDMAGPLYLKDKRKTWICIFTCAIYRAVHFELVTSLSTESFLLALRRFVARRGRCEVIYCDNGTNFVGAARLLKNLDWNKIAADTSLLPIQWKFNPPTAAWWGGFWERLIGVLKKLLRSVLGRASLSYEELVTVLCDCESIVNSRPLTYVSENDNEFIPLSPNLFFQDLKTSGVPDLDGVDHQSLNKRLKYRINLQSDLRKRFRSEYLGALIQRSEKKRASNVSVGDIVLIGSDNTKRINWPLGRVVEVLPGKEGIVRLVRLQTSTGQLLRPIQRLFPLEVTSEVSENMRGKMQAMKDLSKVSQAPIVDDVDSFPRTVTTRYGRVIRTPKRLGL